MGTFRLISNFKHQNNSPSMFIIAVPVPAYSSHFNVETLEVK